MQILTLENKTFFLNDLPDVVDEDLRYAVLDNSDNQNPDYFFLPLIFLESFTGPAVVLRIGKHEITVPLDWCTIVGDPAGPELEVLPLTSLNDRGFRTFTFNPLGSFRPEFYDIDIINVYQDVKWYFPKLKNGHLLAVPLHDGAEPLCALFIKDVGKIPESLDIRKIF